MRALTCRLVLCSLAAWNVCRADAVDDLRNSTDIVLRDIDFSYDITSQGTFSSHIDQMCIPKAARTLDVDFNLAAFGFPYLDIPLHFTGDRVGPGGVRWHTQQAVNRCFTIPTSDGRMIPVKITGVNASIEVQVAALTQPVPATNCGGAETNVGQILPLPAQASIDVGINLGCSDIPFGGVHAYNFMFNGNYARPPLPPAQLGGISIAPQVVCQEDRRTNFTGHVQLTGPSDTPTNLRIVAVPPLSAPGSVTIPAGSWAADFAVTLNDTSFTGESMIAATLDNTVVMAGFLRRRCGGGPIVPRVRYFLYRPPPYPPDDYRKKVSRPAEQLADFEAIFTRPALKLSKRLFPASAPLRKQPALPPAKPR